MKNVLITKLSDSSLTNYLNSQVLEQIIIKLIEYVGLLFRSYFSQPNYDEEKRLDQVYFGDVLLCQHNVDDIIWEFKTQQDDREIFSYLNSQHRRNKFTFKKRKEIS